MALWCDRIEHKLFVNRNVQKIELYLQVCFVTHSIVFTLLFAGWDIEEPSCLAAIHVSLDISDESKSSPVSDVW